MKSFIDVGRRAAAASLAVSDNRSPRDRCARRLRARSAPRVEACGAHCGCSSREFRSVCKSSARYYKAARRIWPFKTAESPWRGYKIAEDTCCGIQSVLGRICVQINYHGSNVFTVTGCRLVKGDGLRSLRPRWNWGNPVHLSLFLTL